MTFSSLLLAFSHDIVQDNVIWQFIFVTSVLLLYLIPLFALVFLSDFVLNTEEIPKCLRHG